MRKVALFASIPSYPTITDDTELWMINTAYRCLEPCGIKRKPDRLYFMDPLDDLQTDARESDFVADVNALGCRVITTRVYPQIEKCEAYPIREVIEKYGQPFFLCTVAYAIAHALYEGVDELTLAGMYHETDSTEYMQHMHCINYWCGRHLESGTRLGIHGPTMVMKAFPWQSDLYGYEGNHGGNVSNSWIRSAYKAALDAPRTFYRTPDFEMAGLKNPRTDVYYDNGKQADPAGDRGEDQRQAAAIEA